MLNRRQLLRSAIAAPAVISLGGWRLGSVLPGDVVSGATLIYGLKCMVKAWANGNCCDITRTSDSTVQTVKFVAGDLDVTTIKTFLSGTTGRVTKWYNQTGTGDSTQVTLANAPFVRVINNVAHLVFDGTFYVSGGVRSLALPAIAWGNSVTAFVVGFQESVFDTGCPLELGQNTTNVTGIYNNGKAHFAVGPTISGVANAQNVWDLNRQVWWFQNTTGSGFGGIGEQEVSPAANMAAIGSPVGGTIGQSVFNQPWAGEIDAVIIYKRLLSTAERLAVRQSLNALYDVSTPTTDLIIMDGDSWGWGRGSQDQGGFAQFSGGQGGQCYGMDRQMLPSLIRKGKWVNYSEPGRQAAESVIDFAANIAPFYNVANRSNTYIIQLGGNDGPGESGGTAAQCLANLQTLLTDGKTTGFKVLVVNLLPFFATGYEAYRQEVNAGIPNLIGIDGVIPIGSGPIMSNPAVVDDLIYYTNDREHPNAYGYSVEPTPDFVTGINTLLRLS